MAKKAILIGKISRVAKLCSSTFTELTIDVSETTIDDVTFTLGTQVSCAVNSAVIRDAETQKVSALAVGDKVTIRAIEIPQFGWVISALSHHRPTDQPLGAFLNDLEKELAKRNN